MLELGAVLAFAVLGWVACAGVGLALVWLRPVGTPAAGPARLGLAACIGLATLLAVGGLGTAIGVPVAWVATAFTVVGLGSCAWYVRSRPVRRPALVRWTTAGVVMFGFVALTGLGRAAFGDLNGCDDTLAYLPMAHRLIDLGTLIEPWSLRRIQNLGGHSYLQALGLGLFGDGGLHLPEGMLSVTFLAGLFVAGGWHRERTRAAGLLVAFLLPFISVPRVSSSAVLLPVPLLLATLVVTTELRASLRRGAPWRVSARWAVAAGVLVAGCAAIRVNTAAAAGITVLGGAVWIPAVPWRERLRTAGVALGAVAVALVGWSISLWQSSGTPLYPLLPGNVNPDVASSTDPRLHGAGAVLERVLELVTVGPYLWATVAVVVLAIVMRRRWRDPQLVVVAAVAVVVNSLFLAASLTISAPEDFARYLFPPACALVVYAVYEAVVMLEAGVDEGAGAARDWRQVLALPVALFCFGWVFHLLRPGDDVDQVVAVGRDIERLVTVATQTELMLDRLAGPADLARYDAALRLAERDGRVIVAVGRPDLIDYSAHDVPNLDLPGWVAPGQRFPLAGGAVAQLRYLREQGYDVLVAAAPGRHECLSLPFATPKNDPDRYEVSKLYRRYYRQWDAALARVVAEAPDAVRRRGRLLVIDLREAQTTLAAGGGGAARS